MLCLGLAIQKDVVYHHVVMMESSLNILIRSQRELAASYTRDDLPDQDTNTIQDINSSKTGVISLASCY